MARVLVSTKKNPNKSEWVDLEDFDSTSSFIEHCETLDICDGDESPNFTFIEWEDVPKCLQSDDEYLFHDNLWDYLSCTEYEQKVVAEYLDEIDSSAEIRDILERFQGENDRYEYIDNLLNDCYGIELPSWLSVDYDKTWNNLSYDFDETDHYIFSNY